MNHSRTRLLNPAWILAIRPKTLPASISPVIVGTALALFDDGMKCLPALAAMMGALLLQIGVNLANDYFDYLNEVDTVDRMGPIRVTQSGLIPPYRVKAATILTFGLVILVGLYLVLEGGWPILAVGTGSILAALAYSGGPYPLGSHGFGDLLVFLFFGLVAVCGTYYVQTHTLTQLTVLSSLPVGLMITAILVVNNLRDINTDRRAGKKTFAVLLGERGARIEFTVLLAAAYLIPVFFLLIEGIAFGILLPMLTAPMALFVIRNVWRQEGSELNETLAGTARLTIVFSFLFSLGLIISS
jgi:1,4-dihydroxy-2-naphthoate octaprenyltransferase